MFVHTCCYILFCIGWFETKLQNDSNGFEKTFEIKEKRICFSLPLAFGPLGLCSPRGPAPLSNSARPCFASPVLSPLGQPSSKPTGGRRPLPSLLSLCRVGPRPVPLTTRARMSEAFSSPHRPRTGLCRARSPPPP